jgi:hypothetical protein
MKIELKSHFTFIIFVIGVGRFVDGPTTSGLRLSYLHWMIPKRLSLVSAHEIPIIGVLYEMLPKHQ